MDREKAIHGLELVKEDIRERFTSGSQISVDCLRIDKAISLLKEQKAKSGEWITIWREDDSGTSTHARCSICNRISERPLGGYCKWCGAKMMGEWGVGR